MVKQFVLCVLFGTFSLNAMNGSEVQCANKAISPMVEVQVKINLIGRARSLQCHPEMIHQDYRNLDIFDLMKQHDLLKEEFEKLAESLTAEEVEMAVYTANQRG